MNGNESTIFSKSRLRDTAASNTFKNSRLIKKFTTFDTKLPVSIQTSFLYEKCKLAQNLETKMEKDGDV